MTKQASKQAEEAIPGLRDFMANSALSMLSNPTVIYKETPEWIAHYCYRIADAMMKERDANPKPRRNLS